MNERLKLLRNALNLNQAEFGKKIGLKQATVGQMETGFRNITIRTLDIICKEFNVNKEWLTTGKGEMFNNSELHELNELCKIKNLDELDKKIILSYIELNEMQKTVVKQFIKNLAKNLED